MTEYYDASEARGEMRFDSRELIESRANIQAKMDDYPDEVENEEEELVNAIDALEKEGITDWGDGAVLIHEDDFKDYAQELANDIAAIPADATWPLNCIDWEQAASELQHDYSTVEFLGHTYHYRS